MSFDLGLVTEALILFLFLFLLTEFIQAVQEVLVSLKPLFESESKEDYLSSFSGKQLLL